MKRMGVIVVLGCLIAAPAAADDIKDLDEAFVKAVEGGDIAALAVLYDQDAALYPPDRMEVKGAKAIGQYWSEFFNAFRVKDFNIVDHGMSTEDDLAVSWGRFTMVMEPKAGGAEMRSEGRFMGTARRKDGKWRYIADHASMVFTPPSAPKAPLK